MTPQRARAYAICVGTLALSLTFFLCGVLSLPVPLYFPLLRRWGMSALPGELSMDYYGRSLLSVLAALFCAPICYWLLCKRDPGGSAPRRRSRSLLPLFGAYAATMLALCTLLYGYKLFTRQAAPEPLPSWYKPH